MLSDRPQHNVEMKRACGYDITELQSRFYEKRNELGNALQLRSSQVSILLHYALDHCGELFQRNDDHGAIEIINKTFKEMKSMVMEKVLTTQLPVDLHKYRTQISIPGIEAGIDQTMWELFNHTRMCTFEQHKVQFYLSQLNHAYPLIDIFFRMKNKLNLLKHLSPILQWIMTVFQQVDHKLTRKDCKRMNVNDFLTRDSDRFRSLEKQFEKFKFAMKEISKDCAVSLLNENSFLN